MSWYVPFAESIKKRACRYLLQRYLGQYLEEKLTLDQLSVDLYKGTGSVSDVSLDCQAINELCASQGLPVEVVEGRVGSVSVSIPWSAPLSNDSFVDVTDLEIILRPKARIDDGTSVLESMWSSMSSSMQLAKDCLEQEGISTTTMGQPLEGLEHFAQIIDSILTRIKVRLTNSVIKLEHCPHNGNTCLTLQINVKNMEYFDEAGSDPPPGVNEETTKYVCSSFTTRHLVFEGISLYTNENVMKSSNTENSAQESTHYFNKLEVSKHKSSGPQNSNFYLSCDRNSLLKESFQNVVVPDTEYVKIKNDDKIIESDDEETVHKPILFGQLMGRQEIQIKMKQSENIFGPKVQLDVTVGSLTCFITPRQLHLLIEIIQVLSNPDSEDTRKKKGHGTMSKPMTLDHFKLVEADLQNRLKSQSRDTGLSNAKGWSTAQIGDDSDNESDFHSFRAFNMTESVMSNNSSSSIVSSIASSNSQISTRLITPAKRAGTSDTFYINNENASEITNYNLRFASLAVIILHEDILTTSSGLCGIGEPRLCKTAIEHLISLSTEFFESMGLYSAFGAKDFLRATTSFDKSCKQNHIRLLAAPVIVEGHERRGPNGSSIEASVTAAKFNINEMRPSQNNNIPLVQFLQMDKPTLVPLISKPQLKAKFKLLERPTRLSRRHVPSRSELSISLEPCICEVDISMMDRISAFIIPPIWATSRNKLSVKPFHSESKFQSENSCEYKLTCEELQIKLRFPVIDLRPKHDPLRLPWWERNVHPDFVIITLNSATGRIVPIENNGQKYELQCQEIVIDYLESEGEKKLAIGHAGSRNKLMSSSAPTKEPETCWPRLTLNIHPAKKKTSLDSSSEGELPISEAMTTSIGGALRNNMQIKDPSPFSAKRMLHKSDTSHASGEAEELIIPGTRVEMEEFYEMSMKDSLIQIELSLQYVSIHLRSKHLYEKIYNHINTDLLLWESNTSFMASAGTGGILQDTPTFSMCKSGIRYDSESSTQDSDSDSNSNGAVFYSVCDRHTNHVNQNSIGFKLTIKQGLLTMFTPVRDSSNHVIPGQQGEFVIRAGDLDLFSVSGFHGDPELSFLCLQAKSAELLHSGLHSVATEAEPLRLVDSCLPSHVQKTILPNPETAHNMTGKSVERDMVTVALRIQANHETKLKHIKMAMGIQEALLMHRSAPPAHTWLTQLIDVFDVQDLPVQGYQPSNVITEIHLHIWDSVVEYRPLNLPLRSRLILGTFSMSSNIITQSTGVNLRFIAEDCALQLSDISHLRSKSMLPDLKYVSVVELGLFELSLRLNDKNSNSPRVDLRASNNALHIRTCADSGRALAQLIAYIAEEGDLTSTKQDETTVGTGGILLHEEEKKIPQKEYKKQETKVNELMAEAMLESLKASTSEIDPDVTGKGVEVFFFPDEAKQLDPPLEPEMNASNKKIVNPPHPQELPKTWKKKNSEIDDDFCIVGDEPGVGVYPLHGHPEIRWLTKEPFYLLDNHFSMPTCKTDLLKAPRDFPMALFRYTLCEITLTWYIYGGNDFPEPLESTKKKVVTIADNSTNMGKINSVSYNAMGPNDININRVIDTRPNKVKTPISSIGVNRKENVLIEVHLNKVRFTHESYPESSCYASRQVLLVGDLEICDRLEISQINKLLYQQSSEQRPRQSHANMIVIKATHTRPDPNQPAQECSLRVALLPLRLNVDQDTLLFLIQFFSELSGSPIDIKPKTDTLAQTSRHSTPTHRVPVMTVQDDNVVADPEKLISDNLMLLLEDQKSKESIIDNVKSNINGDNVPIYFRSVVFSPDVPIRLDYNGKRVELSHGPLAGLLMGLGQLECSELTLKRITHKHGILGVDKLFNFLMQQWLNDIKKRQLPSLLGGIGPIHSVIQLFQGVRDLFWLPIEQYQKDGRIVRGLQRGANSFTACTALAALQITTRIIHIIQATAETAFDMVSPGPSVKRGSQSGRKKGRRGRTPLNPPQDIREGVANAYQVVIEGLGDTASNLVHVASIEHSHKGVSGAVGGVLRQLPPTVVAPLVIASQATQHVLGGVTSQLVPDARLDAKQKWRLEQHQ